MSSYWRNWGFSILLLLPVHLIAQVSSIKHYGLDQHLFPSRTECIEQLKNGELLVGTLAGLMIYDGYAFETIEVADGLAESSISAIDVVGSTAWIGHWSGNISRYDQRGDSVEAWQVATKMEYATIIKIHGISDQDAFVLTSSNKMYHLQNGEVERVLLPLPSSEPLIGFAEHEDQLLLIAESGMLVRSDEDGASPWTNYFLAGEGERLRQALALGADRLLIQSNLGWFLLTRNGQSWSRSRLGSIPNEIIKALDVDLYGNVWGSTERSGVWKYNPATEELEIIQQKNGLSYDETRDVFVDREGVIWIATSAGLDQYLGEAFTRFDRRAGLSANMVWDVALADGKLFIATSDGIDVAELRTDGQPVVVEHLDAEGHEVYQLHMLTEDQLVAITEDGKVWMLDQQGASKQLSGVSAFVYCVEVINGSIWLGTDNGIFVVNPVTEQIQEHLTDQTGLAGDRVTGIYYYPRNDEVWIAALGSELTRLREGKFKQFGEKEGLLSTVIMDASFDHDGNLWLACYDNGVYRFNGEQFMSLKEVVPFSSPTNFAIHIDQKGDVWVANNRGIDHYKPSTNDFESLTEDDGFMGVEVNAGSMAYHPDHGLYMGTLMGLLHFDLDVKHTNPFKPSLSIKKAFLGDVDVLTEEQASGVYDQNNRLDVRFEAVSLVNPNKNQFFYRLVGLHEDWKSMDAPGRVEYHSLPVGDFQLEVRACNNSGVCTTEHTPIAFEILPPFYRTWWFYTLLFFIVVGAIFLMDRYRAVALLDDKRRLGEILEQKEQRLIELDQDRESLINERRVDTRFMELIQHYRAEKEEEPTELLNAFGAWYKSLDGNAIASSKTVLTGSAEGGDFVILLDCGIYGNAARGIIAELRLSLVTSLQEAKDHTSIVGEWKRVVSELEAYFSNFRGISWMLLIKDIEGKVHAHTSGMAVFANLNGIYEPVNGMKDLAALPADTQVIVVPESTFEQLNEAGTKSYGKKQLLTVLDDQKNSTTEAMANAFFASVKEWRGALEQFDDLAFYGWKTV